MFWKEKPIAKLMIFVFALLCTLFAQRLCAASSPNERPVADAGLPRYAATDPVTLDGTGSFDPDNSGPLSYEWSQVGGPSVTITDANTARPTVGGFTQTGAIQRCEFELVVSDGELTSLPDRVEVIIVPAVIDCPDPYGNVTTLVLKTGIFDPEKPTFVFFGGGWCSYGYGGWSPLDDFSEWFENANFINFSWYEPDSEALPHTYIACGNILITYLSSVAPDYKQPIQTLGHSTGAMPAIGVANYLNTTYTDSRYAVNRVTLCDPGWASGCHDVRPEVAAFYASPVDGEQCWVDYYYSGSVYSPANGALNVYFPQNHHRAPVFWHYWSLNEATWLGDIFNGGVTAGLYLSVRGPGKNLQLATEPDSVEYYFEWQGEFHYVAPPLLPTFSPGTMTFYDEPSYAGRLPEPVTLLEPVYVEDARGYILTCEESQNAVGYELLVGADPYRVMDYEVISDTPAPPNDVVATLPFEAAYWTVRVRDQYGSTIYADPERIDPALNKVADFDGNGRVDFIDFAEFGQLWQENQSSGDISSLSLGDDTVDFRDVALFSEYWLASLDRPPVQASDPEPAKGAVDVETDVALSWTAGYGSLWHDVYFGETNPPAFVCNQTETTFNPGTLEQGPTCFWRIDEINSWGKTKGAVWSFTTVWPEEAWGPRPEDGATSVVPDPDVTLSWNLGDLETEGYTVSYIVYFGTDEAAPAELDTVEPTRFDVSGLDPSTTYYWRIDTKRKLDRPPFTVIITPGNIWSFTTGP